jgi:hypothetical protein
MSTVATFDPLVSEFESEALESEHTAWIRAQLDRRRAQPRQSIPHDEVVQRMEDRLALWREQHKATA